MLPRPATHLADFVSTVQKHVVGRSLAEEVERRARVVLLDTVGVIIAGGQSDRSKGLAIGDGVLHRSWLSPQPSEDAPARVLLTPPAWASVEHATLLHGTVGCALELDEGYRPTGHPAIHMVPALLAAGEALDASLDEVLRALVCGYEVAGAMFESFRLKPEVHPHGHIGGMAASVALAVLRRRDPVPYAAAAGTLPLLTLWSACLDGATVRNTWAGQAGLSAINAHRLVDSGHRGSIHNLGDALTRTIGSPVRDLDYNPDRPRILNGYFKFHSGCALTHPAVEAALKLGGFTADDIHAVEVVVNANSMRIAGLRTETDLSRRFSIPYAVAAALILGSSSPEAYAELDATVAAVAAKVTVLEDPMYTQAWPDQSSARITVTNTYGNTESARCLNPIGSPGDVASEHELPDKFARCTGSTSSAWGRLIKADGRTSIAHWLTEVVREVARDALASPRVLPGATPAANTSAPSKGSP